jgi:hypothetical protein
MDDGADVHGLGVGGGNSTNAHMQLLIDEFRGIYNANEEV